MSNLPDFAALDPASQKLWVIADEVIRKQQQAVADLADVVAQLAGAVFDLEDAVFPEGKPCKGE